ncbi:MAG TPA: allantoate amidohydrolase [Opitutaceae bacterium]|nr:allantoate amidohydrolase [Opitutaceae bacterium]
MSGARELRRMIDELAQVSEESGRLTRTFLSPAMERAAALVGGWMREAGMETREDSVGNLIGLLKSQTPDARPGTPELRPKTLIVGSHLDTVRNAGRFDGSVGVLLPIVALRVLASRGVKLPFNVEVVGFSEEEGVRFASGDIGSEAFCGRLTEATLALRDSNGVTMREALETRNGRPFAPPATAHHRGELLGYVETHIEQGPMLEAAGLAVGVVSAIVGQSRFQIVWRGKAGHAGTTPMRLRRDALSGAAEFAIAVERLARKTRGLVATIGVFDVLGGASNVIPGEVRHTLDIRHAADDVRKEAVAKVRAIAAAIAARRSLRCVVKPTQDDRAVSCSPELTAQLAESVRRVQGRSIEVPSGAGHDGVTVSRIAPVAMLFVRSRDGLSHHPDEFTSHHDLGVALRVMIDFLTGLAQRHS